MSMLEADRVRQLWILQQNWLVEGWQYQKGIYRCEKGLMTEVHPIQ